jgi:hypothetical protein
MGGTSSGTAAVVKRPMLDVEIRVPSAKMSGIGIVARYVAPPARGLSTDRDQQ